MNVAIIFAGGTGQRMNTRTKPKQFLELHGKPIIIYTLEVFDRHPDIDGIVVVCLESWIGELERLIDFFRLRKVAAIVPGGASGQESIRNGIMKAAELYPEDALALVHDGVRPLVSPDTISACIETAHKEGSAVTVVPAVETIVQREGSEVTEIADRSKCFMARAPQCFFLGELVKAHNQAIADGRDDFVDTASMMHHYGKTLHTVDGTVENIKITTPTDFYLFRAIQDAREDSQIFGF